VKSFYVFVIDRAVVLPTDRTPGSDAASCMRADSSREAVSSNLRASRRRGLLWFESIADRGLGSVDCALNSNKLYRRLPHMETLQLRRSRVSGVSHPQRLVSISW